MDRKAWLSIEVSKRLVDIDLEHSIVWNGERGSLTVPFDLSVLLNLLHRYELKIDPDWPLVYSTASWDNNIISVYYARNGFSAAARKLLDDLITNPGSGNRISGLVHFVDSSGIQSSAVDEALKRIVLDPTESRQQIDALYVMAKRGVGADVLNEVRKNGASEQLQHTAFCFLVDRQDQATIERALTALLQDDEKLTNGETPFPVDTRLVWIAKINSTFAIPKLTDLRVRTLALELPRLTMLIAQTLQRINRLRAARIIRDQIKLAPAAWQEAQRYIADEQERDAQIETTRGSPFIEIVARLKGFIARKRLKLWCEGPTDVPIFRSLLRQITETPDIWIDFVGGWPLLAQKDPKSFLHGCSEAIVVMDGDLGRDLGNSKKPLTKIAKEQMQKFAGLPVQLRVLERYGIENYFPRSCLESIVGQDLSRFFPIPDRVSVREFLRDGQTTWWQRSKRFLVFRFGLKLKLRGLRLYSKNSNERVAQILVLDRDLIGTDLWSIVHLIAKRAKELAEV